SAAVLFCPCTAAAPPSCPLPLLHPSHIPTSTAAHHTTGDI
ncbi:hypothetical protein A2U01_0043885, partial [Trifolium medium]|nr:hypothetical protein [Trifolium medium]